MIRNVIISKDQIQNNLRTTQSNINLLQGLIFEHSNKKLQNFNFILTIIIYYEIRNYLDQRIQTMFQAFRSFNSKLAVLQTRFALQLSMHPIIMTICLFIAAMHTWITVLYPTNQVIIVIKYLEPTMLLNSQIMLYVLSTPIILVSIFIIREILVSFFYGTIILNTFQKYLFKTIGNLGWICCYVLTLPVVRTSLYAIKNTDGFTLGLGWIILLLYTILIVPFYGLFLNDPSPRFGNSYAKLYYFDYIRLMPMLRLIMAYANVLQKLAHVSFVYTFLVISMFILLKEPILYYKFDRYHRKMVYLMLWIFMIRGTANLNDAPITGTVIFMTAPIFVISITYLADMRVIGILHSEKVTVKKLTYFIYMLLNYANNLKYTLLFLLYHKKSCANPECICRKLNSGEIENQENQQNQEINIKHWHQFGVALIDSNFNQKLLDTLLASDKKKLLGKLVNIGIVKADVMVNVLKKWNTTYYQLEKINYNYKQQGWICHTFHAYRLRFLHKMTQFLSQQCRQKGTINDFASSYFQSQNQIQELIISIQKSIQSYLQIWKEFQDTEPNSQKLLSLIKKNYSQCCIIGKKIKRLTHKNKELKMILMKYYLPYYQLVCNTPIFHTIPKIQVVEKISQEMKRFSIDSKTCTSLVMISQGEQFGKILSVNIYFELMTGFSPKQYLNVDSLIPFNEQKHHREKMIQFLNRNQLNRENYFGLIKLKNEKLKAVEIMLQLYPSVVNGLMACTFIFETKEKFIFSYTSDGKILQYNDLFKLQFEDGFEYLMKSYGFISRDQLYQLVEKNQIEINLQQSKYIISLKKIKHINKEQCLYICYAERNIESSFSQDSSEQEEAFENTTEVLNMKVNQQTPQHIIDSKKTKDKNQKQSAQKEKLEEIFEIVNNEKSVKNITIWIIFTIICFVLVEGLVIGCIVSIYEKQNIIYQQLVKKNDIQIACSKIVDSLYFFRRAHIAAKINSNIQQFQYNELTFGNLNKQVSGVFEQYNIRSYILEGMVYDVNVNLQISQSKADYFVIVNQMILVTLTTFTKQQMDNFKFPLRVDQIVNTTSIPDKNFLELNLNSLKQIIPKFGIFANLINSEVLCKSGQCIYMDPNVYLYPIIMIIFILMIIVSCAITIKIKYIKFSTYSLLINLQQGSILTREAKVGTYIGKNPIYDFERNFLPEQQNMYRKDPDEGKINEKSMETSKNRSVISRFLTNISMEQTQRQLIKEHADQGQQSQKQFNKKKRKFVFPQFSMKKIVCKYILLLLPALILLSAIIILFYQSNYMILNQINRLDLLYQRLRMIKQVKLYDLEIGLQASPNTAYKNEILVNQQLKLFISQLYNVERTIKTSFDPSDSSIGSEINKFNQQNICENLNILSLKENFDVKFTKSQCQNLVGQSYLTKGMRNTLVALLERSRLIEQKYSKYNETDAETIQFLNLQDLEIFRKIDYYLNAITIYEINFYLGEIKSMRNVISTILLVLSLILFIYSGVLIVIMLKACRKGMFEDIVQIKAIFQLISLQTIRSSKTLSNITLNENNYEFLK